MRRYLITLALLGGTFACSNDPPGPPNEIPPPASAPARANDPATEPEPVLDPEQQRAAATAELFDTLESLAKLHQRHADDCPALAGELRRFHAEHMTNLAAVPDEILASIDADEALRVRLRSAMEAIMSASMSCREDPTFAAMQAELFPSSSP